MRRVTAISAARYLLWRAQHGRGPLSNMEVLKLLYLAQGWFLALYDQPLFGDRIEAWPRGPVQPAVYGQYRHFVWMPIPPPESEPDIPEHVASHLDSVYATFGHCGALTLSKLTHCQDPWLRARQGLKPWESSNNEISVTDMHKYFKELLSGRVVETEFEWSRQALIERAQQEERRFQESLAWVDQHYGEALRRLAE